MSWSSIANLQSVASPGLLVDPATVKANIDLMITAVGGRADRLRPHVKTHKMPEAIQLQSRAGITKFKAATIAEAEMIAATCDADCALGLPIGGAQCRSFSRLDRSISPELFFHDRRRSGSGE